MKPSRRRLNVVALPESDYAKRVLGRGDDSAEVLLKNGGAFTVAANDVKHSPTKSATGASMDAKHSPKGETASPGDAKHSPNNTVSPGDAKHSPKAETASPGDAKHSPNNTVSPGDAKHSPKGETASPGDAKHSPKAETGDAKHSPRNEPVGAGDAKHSPKKSGPGESIIGRTADGRGCVVPGDAIEGTVTKCTFLPLTAEKSDAPVSAECKPVVPLDDRKHKQVKDCLVVFDNADSRRSGNPVPSQKRPKSESVDN